MPGQRREGNIVTSYPKTGSTSANPYIEPYPQGCRSSSLGRVKELPVKVISSRETKKLFLRLGMSLDLGFKPSSVVWLCAAPGLFWLVVSFESSCKRWLHFSLPAFNSTLAELLSVPPPPPQTTGCCCVWLFGCFYFSSWVFTWATSCLPKKQHPCLFWMWCQWSERSSSLVELLQGRLIQSELHSLSCSGCLDTP